MVNDDGDCQSKLNVQMGGVRQQRGERQCGTFINRAEAKCKVPQADERG